MQNDDLLLEQVQDLKLKNEGFKKVVGRLQQTNKELSAGWVAMEKERDELKAINRELAEVLQKIADADGFPGMDANAKGFVKISKAILAKYNSTNQ